MKLTLLAALTLISGLSAAAEPQQAQNPPEPKKAVIAVDAKFVWSFHREFLPSLGDLLAGKFIDGYEIRGPFDRTQTKFGAKPQSNGERVFLRLDTDIQNWAAMLHHRGKLWNAEEPNLSPTKLDDFLESSLKSARGNQLDGYALFIVADPVLVRSDPQSPTGYEVIPPGLEVLDTDAGTNVSFSHVETKRQTVMEAIWLVPESALIHYFQQLPGGNADLEHPVNEKRLKLLKQVWATFLLQRHGVILKGLQIQSAAPWNLAGIEPFPIPAPKIVDVKTDERNAESNSGAPTRQPKMVDSSPRVHSLTIRNMQPSQLMLTAVFADGSRVDFAHQDLGKARLSDGVLEQRMDFVVPPRFGDVNLFACLIDNGGAIFPKFDYEIASEIGGEMILTSNRLGFSSPEGGGLTGIRGTPNPAKYSFWRQIPLMSDTPETQQSQ